MAARLYALSKKMIMLLIAGSLLIIGVNEAARRFTKIGMEKTTNAVCFALDCNISMIGEPLAAATNAVQRSLQQFPDGMEAALVTFQKEAQTVVPKTTNYRLLLEALPTLSATGTTGISEGILESEKALSSVDGVRSIILFTDGKNGEERISAKVAQELRKHRTALFLIGILGTEGDNLKQIAEDSGGSFLSLEEGLSSAVSGVVYRAEAGRNLKFSVATAVELIAFWVISVLLFRLRKRKEPQSGSLPNAGYLKREEVKRLIR